MAFFKKYNSSSRSSSSASRPSMYAARSERPAPTKAPAYDVVLGYALRALGRRRLTEKQLREKIQKRYRAPEGEETAKLSEHIERVMVRVKELNYVNDRDYAEIFIRDTMQYRPHGTMWIKQQLMKKGVESDDVAHALEQMREEGMNSVVSDEGGIGDGEFTDKNPDREYTGALELARKKLRTLERVEPKKRYEKLFRFLASRGFSASMAFRAMEEIGLSRRGEMGEE